MVCSDLCCLMLLNNYSLCIIKCFVFVAFTAVLQAGKVGIHFCLCCQQIRGLFSVEFLKIIVNMLLVLLLVLFYSLR